MTFQDVIVELFRVRPARGTWRNRATRHLFNQAIHMNFRRVNNTCYSAPGHVA